MFEALFMVVGLVIVVAACAWAWLNRYDLPGAVARLWLNIKAAFGSPPPPPHV
jgi:hypothetical protein